MGANSVVTDVSLLVRDYEDEGEGYIQLGELRAFIDVLRHLPDRAKVYITHPASPHDGLYRLHVSWETPSATD